MFVSTYQLSVHEQPLHKTVNTIAEHDKRSLIRTVVITRIGLLTVHVRLDWVLSHWAHFTVLRFAFMCRLVTQ